MKFKISLTKHPEQKDVVSCVDWNGPDEVFSCSDDHLILKWNLVSKDSVKFCELPSEISPIDFHVYSKSQGTLGVKKSGTGQDLLLTSADGRFHLIGKTGRIEKSVESHNGATLVGRWSHDGAGILTAGEDGQVKIWSRNGLLRTTLISGGPPVYSAAWSPDSNKVLLTQAKSLVIKPLSPNNKATKWQAHDGLILKVAWCSSSDLILSGGEDCKYKVWDTDGRQLYTSLTHDHPISSLAWAPGGDMFAVGSYNTLRLCDKVGWSHSLDKPDTGSVYDLVWSNDATQIAGACANGSLLLGTIIQRKLEWQNYEAIQSGRKSLLIRDVLSDIKEKVELPERIILISLSHAHLVLTLPSHCYVYNFNTPCIIELRDSNTSMILQAEK
ncbi:hypothetical protein M8J75_015860 [Diaphorina citri]|nr:hypothetical protein M8J75_015860 [Diaphorina citri]